MRPATGIARRSVCDATPITRAGQESPMNLDCCAVEQRSAISATGALTEKCQAKRGDSSSPKGGGGTHTLKPAPTAALGLLSHCARSPRGRAKQFGEIGHDVGP